MIRLTDQKAERVKTGSQIDKPIAQSVDSYRFVKPCGLSSSGDCFKWLQTAQGTQDGVNRAIAMPSRVIFQWAGVAFQPISGKMLDSHFESASTGLWPLGDKVLTSLKLRRLIEIAFDRLFD
jgi:hypothetical protein